MHWFALIALWAVLTFTMLEIASVSYRTNYDIITALIWISGIMFAVWGFRIQAKKEKQKQNEALRIKEREKRKQQCLCEEYGLPINCQRYRHVGGYNKFPNGRWLHVWRDNKHLNLLSKKGGIEKHQIPLSDINFYSIKGDVRQEMEIKDGDLSVGETVIAEGMLGTAAAMKRNQPTQSIKTIDERKTIINASTNEKDSYIFFEGAELYNYLLKNIPEKEQSFVAMNK